MPCMRRRQAKKHAFPFHHAFPIYLVKDAMQLMHQPSFCSSLTPFASIFHRMLNHQCMLSSSLFWNPILTLVWNPILTQATPIVPKTLSCSSPELSSDNSYVVWVCLIRYQTTVLLRRLIPFIRRQINSYCYLSSEFWTVKCVSFLSFMSSKWKTKNIYMFSSNHF